MKLFKKLIYKVDYHYYNLGVILWSPLTKIAKIVYATFAGLREYCIAKRSENWIIRITHSGPKKKKRNRRRKHEKI